MRKVALVFLILLMTITVSTLNEDPQNSNSFSQEATSSFPVGISKLLIEDTRNQLAQRTEEQGNLLMQSDNLFSLALPVGFIGAVDAVDEMRRDTVLAQRRAEAAAQRAAEEARQKALRDAELLAQAEAKKVADMQKQTSKTTVTLQIQEEIANTEVEFVSPSVSEEANNLIVKFTLRNLGEELRVGTIHFTLHFSNNEKIDFSEVGSYRFRMQVPKEYTLVMTSQMLEQNQNVQPAYLSVTLKNDAGETFSRKNFLL